MEYLDCVRPLALHLHLPIGMPLNDNLIKCKPGWKTMPTFTKATLCWQTVIHTKTGQEQNVLCSTIQTFWRNHRASTVYSLENKAKSQQVKFWPIRHHHWKLENAADTNSIEKNKYLEYWFWKQGHWNESLKPFISLKNSGGKNPHSSQTAASVLKENHQCLTFLLLDNFKVPL